MQTSTQTANEKRYVFTLDLFSYSENDTQAKAKADQLIKDIQFLIDRTDNQASILSIVEAPFGSLQTREVA